MSNDKIKKVNFWKNFVGLSVLFSIIFLIFYFNIPIHFSVFENIEAISPIIIITSSIIIIIIVILVIFIIIYIKRRNKKENEE